MSKPSLGPAPLAPSDGRMKDTLPSYSLCLFAMIRRGTAQGPCTWQTLPCVRPFLQTATACLMRWGYKALVPASWRFFPIAG